MTRIPGGTFGVAALGALVNHTETAQAFVDALGTAMNARRGRQRRPPGSPRSSWSTTCKPEQEAACPGRARGRHGLSGATSFTAVDESLIARLRQEDHFFWIDLVSPGHAEVEARQSA